MERVTCLGLPNCRRLANDDVELVVTTDVGPRIARYAFHDGENVLGEAPGPPMVTPLGAWHARGGHRLWAAPESRPRTYAPDDEPVAFSCADDRTIELRAPVEPATGLEKTITVMLGPTGSAVLLLHRITNRALWPLRFAPWALTIMAPGGTAIVPQEPYRTWDEDIAPARPLVLWHYTDLRDPRFDLGARHVRLRVDAAREAPQKFGVLNTRGWAAYHAGTTLFVKRVAHVPGAAYPDFGVNTEVYTAGTFIELETLGPLVEVAPGDAATHVEEWRLLRDVAAHDDAIAAAVRPLLDEWTAD